MKKLSELFNSYDSAPAGTDNKPIYRSTGSGNSSDHTSVTSQKTQTLAPWTDIPHVDVPEPECNAPDTSKIHNTGMYDLIKSYQRPTYEEDMQRAKRQQTAGMISDLAGLFSKSVGMSKGQRIFPQTRSNTDAANAGIENIRQLQRGEKEDYNNKLLNAREQDYQQDKIDKQNALQNAMYLYRLQNEDKKDAIKTNKDIDFKNADMRGKVLTNSILSKKVDNEAQHDRNTEAIQRERNNISRENGALSRAIALKKLQTKVSSSGGSAPKDMDSIWINEGHNGLSEWYFPKVSKGSVAGLYEQMKTKYPKEVQDLESTTISLGGDKQNDRLAVVKQMMQEHPELTNMFTRIQGVRRASSFYPKAKTETHQPQVKYKPVIKKGWGANINKWK